MLYIIVGLIVGIAIGVYAPMEIPAEFARYTAVGIIGIFDSILGAIRADLQKKYRTTIFLSGLFFNMIFAMLITYLGDRLGLDLYLAVLVVFMIRIFQNIATIRYVFLENYLGRKRVQEEIKKQE